MINYIRSKKAVVLKIFLFFCTIFIPMILTVYMQSVWGMFQFLSQIKRNSK